MRATNIYEAKTQLSKLIELALHGEEVVISKSGKPLVRLVPYEDTHVERKPGRLKGKIKIAKDFDVLPKEILEAFEGKK